MKGKDGQIRGAVVRVARRDRQHLYLKRPIQLLYPLEIHCQHSDPNPVSQNFISEEYDPEEDTSPRVRLKRAAARKAEELRKVWISELEKDDSDDGL